MENGCKNVQRVWENMGIANWRIRLFKRWRPIYSAYTISGIQLYFPSLLAIIC